jgi:hypothetical protein
MDAGKVFVLLISIFVIGILAFLELKSRRTRKESEGLAEEVKKTSGDIRR